MLYIGYLGNSARQHGRLTDWLARCVGLSQATGASVQCRAPVDECKSAARTISPTLDQVKGKNMTMASSGKA